MRTFPELVNEVFTWSTLNFSSQNSKRWEDMPLRSLLPLLGLVEELGEYTGSSSTHDLQDAVGDMVIYFCDFVARSPVDPEKIVNGGIRINTMDPVRRLAIAIGRLAHVELKSHQGIRGFDNAEHHEEKLLTACRDVWANLPSVTTMSKEPRALQIANETFDKIVAKRNWVKNPEEGNG